MSRRALTKTARLKRNSKFSTCSQSSQQAVFRTNPASQLKTTPHWLEGCFEVQSTHKGIFDAQNAAGAGCITMELDASEPQFCSTSLDSAVALRPHEPCDATIILPRDIISSRHHNLVKHILRLKARRQYRCVSIKNMAAQGFIASYTHKSMWCILQLPDSRHFGLPMKNQQLVLFVTLKVDRCYFATVTLLRSTCEEFAVLGIDLLRSLSSSHSHSDHVLSNHCTSKSAAVVCWQPEATLLLTDCASLATNASASGLHALKVRLATRKVMNLIFKRNAPTYAAIPGGSKKTLNEGMHLCEELSQTVGVFKRPQPCRDFLQPRCGWPVAVNEARAMHAKKRLPLRLHYCVNRQYHNCFLNTKLCFPFRENPARTDTGVYRLVLAFDRLKYVWNLGILLRCAGVMGVDGLFFVDGTADPFNWKTLVGFLARQKPSV